MNLTVLNAIFKRDFVNYFASATGYVFICVFVLLSSAAAFLPDEFFSNNLANLDQLSKWMPYILLVFVPAITMSIWAEEKRRGTDELLLTLPATDFDVVIGKYLAGVAIFTVSLLFAMGSILLVFSYGLGEPDPWLFCCTFLGYWFVGLAMLATGMVASFLTANLTVGFILGMVFNAPQAFASSADSAIESLAAVPLLKPLVEADWFRDLAYGVLSSFSAFEGVSDFTRGVVSLSGILYFLCIVALMLYVCMVLIGRRHWAGGDDGESLWWHYLLRGLALFLIVGGVNTILRNYDSLRYDMTADKVNSLSPKTTELVQKIGDDDDLPAVKIDAYVSPTVPSEYAGQKRELMSALAELRSISRGKVVVVLHEIETFSEEATLAERTYGIEPRSVTTRVRGELEEEQIFLGAAISCGLDKVVIPFLDKGIPVEYELVRSITTVAQQKRKRIGVVKTDAPLFSSFSMQGPTPESELVAELKKQYDVVEVDPASPITDTFDVLLAVQPSSLSPEALDNFVAAVKTGQPTAIFEDPLPVMWQGIVGTDEPKQAGGGGMMGMFGGRQPPVPKGDMQQLWKLLGARMSGGDLIWQKHNPYQQTMPQVTDEWVFVDADAADNAFSEESEITSGLKQALFLHSGSVKATPGAKTSFQPLAVTSTQSGTVPTRTVQGVLQQRVSPFQLDQDRSTTNQPYVLAARIVGKPPEQEGMQLDETVDEADLLKEAQGGGGEAAADGEEPAEDEAEESDEEQPEINVVLVTDIDCLANQFFEIRQIGADEILGIDFRLQNIALVLNILDDLADDDRYVALRKRTRDYRTLGQFEDATKEFRQDQLDKEEEIAEEVTSELENFQQRYRDTVAEVEKRSELDPLAKRQLKERVRMRAQRELDVQIAAKQQESQREKRQSQASLEKKIRSLQDRYKFAALVVPPIPPILLALWVYFRRRANEQEGVSKDRLRYAKTDPTPEGGAAA